MHECSAALNHLQCVG